MLRVGLTGGIGAGKSTVAARLAQRGAVVIDADRLAREVVEPGTEGLAEVVVAFGDGVLAPDGTLDRAALGRQVFADADARARLNAILHPRIGVLTAERMRAAGPDAIVVHDVPLLVENGLGPAYHLVLVVHADVAERIRRLVADRGMPAEDAASRVAAQTDDDARRAAADVWLDNSGAPQALLDAVDRVWTERILPYAENLRKGRPAEPGEGGAGAGRGGGPGPDAVRRVRERLALAVGGGPDVEVAGLRDGQVEFTVRVPDAAAAGERLAEAGFVPVPAPRGEHWCAGADPAIPVLVRLVAAGRRPVPGAE
ncbi:MAG TPA: dephospho-CoA kinase [Kineosporiaceae bacterium]